MIPLYHWTCGHGLAGIGGRGILLPTATHSPHLIGQIAAGGRTAIYSSSVVWLTDLPAANARNRRALGLTRLLSRCDRMQYRYRIIGGSSARPWTDLRDHWPQDVVDDLESADGAEPGHWWVSHAVEGENDR